jgi:hypothetical protein
MNTVDDPKLLANVVTMAFHARSVTGVLTESIASSRSGAAPVAPVVGVDWDYP